MRMHLMHMAFRAVIVRFVIVKTFVELFNRFIVTNFMHIEQLKDAGFLNLFTVFED